MANVIPFKGTLYNPEKIKDLSKVMAPPYDVISPQEQAQLYDSEAHNIIHILLGKVKPDDNEKEDKYTRAAGCLKDWQAQDVLKKDNEPCIYVYEQEFEVDGRDLRRLGFISLLKLEEFDREDSSIHPHENTLSAPKKDRTKLISSIESNLGPIFAIFADDNQSIDNILAQATKSQPIIDVVDHHGIKNRLWRLSDKERIEKIVNLMKDKKLFIADGHHRYEVGLEFSKTKKDPKFGYILTYFTDLCADGIVVLPTHRLISGVDKSKLSELKQDLKKHFTTEEISSKEKAKDFLSKAVPPEKRFVIYEKDGFTGLCVKSNNSLDVSVLHDMVIEPLKKKVASLSIDFTKDIEYAVKEVNEGRFSLSVILNSTKVTEVRDMALSGKRMPQKSTYFYPKVLTGLVINVF
ncbi:MAG: DUF1015 domain-containing protein [Candidatus Gorgyraea atricola]|nr:DUF1015 domain-containing protein [Candidatus Gorgyraea atricola]